MGRRALGKSNSELDISAHLLSPECLPQPWDQAQMFQLCQSLEVEIGTGKGLFLQRQASAMPSTNYLGIEISLKYARFAASKLARAALTNARILHADARRTFSDHFPDGSLSGIHIYFPDPWWKKRHHKRRLLTPDFVRELTRTLVPEGIVHFWTDVAETYEAGLAALGSEQRLQGPHPVSSKEAEHDLDYQTHFERRMRLRGKPIYRSEFTRV